MLFLHLKHILTSAGFATRKRSMSLPTIHTTHNAVHTVPAAPGPQTPAVRILVSNLQCGTAAWRHFACLIIMQSWAKIPGVLIQPRADHRAARIAWRAARHWPERAMTRFLSYSLIIVAGLAFNGPALPSASSGNVGLFIGNANYSEGATTLPVVLGDTRTLADEFRRNNFDVEVKENLGVKELRRAVDAFVARIRDGSAAVFYFNGYGLQAGRQTFLLPVDAQVSSEAAVRRDGVSIDATVAEMHKRGAKVKIIIIDAARRNPYETRFRTSPGGLATLDMPDGTIALYSAAPGKVMSDRRGANSALVTE